MIKMTKTLEELEAELEVVRAERAEVDERLKKIYAAYQEKLSEKLDAEFDVADIVRHAWSNHTAHEKLDNYAKSLGLQLGAGYWGDGEDENPYVRVAPRFYLGKDEDVSRVEAGIREFCKTFKGYCEKDGMVYLDFMENTLSERGSYSIMWYPGNGRAHLRKMTYGHEDKVFKGTLREVLEYVAKNLWYGEPYEDDEEEDRW